MRARIRAVTLGEAPRQESLGRPSRALAGGWVMQRLRRASWMAVGSVLWTAALVASVADGATKPRTILLLPFVTVDLARDEQWLGEAVAQ